MKVTILGSGTFIPNLKRNAAGYLLEADGKKVLIDCGSGTLLQLEKIKPKLYEELDYIFITHTHVDHISDLDALLHVLKWNKSERTKRLNFVGPVGFKEYYQSHLSPIVGETDKFEINVSEISEFSDFNVESIKTKHTEEPPSIAYKFEFEGNKFVFSGDTGYFNEFVDFCKNSDILILECTIATTAKEHWDGHLNAEQCLEIASKSNCKKLILSHLPADEEDNQKKLEIVKKEFENVELAYDLMEIEL